MNNNKKSIIKYKENVLNIFKNSFKCPPHPKKILNKFMILKKINFSYLKKILKQINSKQSDLLHSNKMKIIKNR